MAAPAPHGTEQPSGDFGTVRASFASDVFTGDVVAVRIDVLQGGAVVATQTVQPPAGDAGTLVVDAYFVLPPGGYEVVVTPLNSEGQPATSCDTASTSATVAVGVTTEVELSLFCDGQPTGGLDVNVTGNRPPRITNLTFDPSKFINLCQPVVITVEATGQAPLMYQWLTLAGPEDGNSKLLSNGHQALFEAMTPGVYTVEVVVTDPQHRTAGLSFPVHVAETGVCTGTQPLRGYISKAMAAAPWVSLVPATTPVTVAIGLPMHNADGLDQLINQISDPSNPSFRQYLTPAQFASQYGASEADYQALVAFAQVGGNLSVRTYGNRLLVDVSGTAADIGSALHVNFSYYLRPDGTTFYGPDREPSLDLTVPVLHVTGLDSFTTPTPRFFPLDAKKLSSNLGTGQGGSIFGNDFRTAYASCTALTGTGQSVGLFQLDGFASTDITGYEAAAGLPNVPVRTVLLDGFSGTPGAGGVARGAQEVTLDIEMAMSMAPGLLEIVVFEGTNPASILHAMATESPISRQLSSSWGFGSDDNQRQALAEFAVQGQTYFDASGDTGAFTSDPGDNTDDPFTSLVGGTVLTLKGAGTAYQSETGWPGSSGGILSNTAIPGFQQGVSMATNGGSTTNRNAPDVALVASGVEMFFQGAPAFVSGTSIAAPLWAGFTALINEQAAQNSTGVLGFANPVFYAIGELPAVYAASFNDIQDGSGNGGFTTVAGYDLVTGWGSPTCGLIGQLASPTPTVPASFGEIEFLITTGGDDLRGDSAGTAALFAPGASSPFQTISLKADGAGSWDNGSIHDLVIPLTAPQGPNGIGSIVITLIQGGSFPETDDNWNIESMNARLLNPRGPEICLIDLQGDPEVRLTGSAGSFNFAVPSGCPTGPNTAPTTVNTVEFVVSTGGDDLRQDSTATADLFAPGASSPFETVTLKNNGENAWNNNTVHTVVVPLSTPQTGIGQVTIHLIQGGSFPESDDNWNIQGMSIVAFNPGGPQLCINDLNGNPLVRLTGSAGDITFAGGSGCP